MPLSDLRHRLLLAVRRLKSRHGRAAGARQPIVLHEDADLLISWLPGAGHRAVLAFAGMVVALGGRQPLEFVGVAAAEGRHVLFVSDLRHSWYSHPGLQDRIVRVVQDFCAAQGITDLCTIGNSMGGYGAILFASLLPVRHVAAFVPQILLTPELLAMQQWDEARACIQHGVVRDLVPGMLTSTARFTLVYGDQDIDDNIHAAHLPKAANIDPLIVKGCDHKVSRWLKDRGVLAALGSAMLDGRADLVDHFRHSLNQDAALAV